MKYYYLHKEFSLSQTNLTMVFKENHKSLCFFANRYVKDSNAALDIIEESFLKLWAKREQFGSEAGLRSYLYKTVYNGCLRWLENEKRKAHNLETYRIITDSPEQTCFENMVRAETLRQLHTAIEQLPGQCRTIVQKLYVDGKSVSEIATEMNLATSTVKNQKARGIKLLKLKLT
ncbi:RNA polymerase sigma factor [Lacibacter sp.]|uniref:RNA polymerase sigma factor n=1 Tax=Lacibacter sp. TaxID=1915409 RepID=UPI002B4B496D|nr:sigma-70 family RNA polymerase sigma factor [Lacibacter sp.]HLP39736.1 sigma-70 family RNA polymerase sigma factor [Lacibacter sp.]